ncbi:MAG: thioredoxin family protein [Hyphomicrobium sp.]
MPRLLYAALLALTFVIPALLVPAAAIAATPEHAGLFNGAEINWRDPRSGIYEASTSGKPVIMVMHATWCPSCKRYRAVFNDPAIVAASKDFVMILVDVDKEKQINGAFSPDGTYVPRTLFIDADGDVSTKFVGRDPQYPHTIDVDKPDELLALMLKAKASGFGAPTKSDAPQKEGRT